MTTPSDTIPALVHHPLRRHPGPSPNHNPPPTPNPPQTHPQIGTYFETTATGALTRRGFMQLYHTQTSARPRDTVTDLSELGGAPEELLGELNDLADRYDKEDEEENEALG